MTKPGVIEFRSIGETAIGYISVSEFTKTIPFEVKRMFWTYFTPESVVRGRHAHHETEQVLIAVAGRITLTLESPQGEISVYVLDKPDKGVYIPHDHWHTMQYSHNAVQLVLASTEYKEDDYIRDYNQFKSVHGNQ